MKSPASLAVLLALALACPAFAGEFPPTVQSPPCAKAPVIDGIIDAEEWRGALLIEFEMNFASLNPIKLQPRTCQFRVMNSANGLYVAVRIPDAVRQHSLAPLEIDLTQLAFCREKERTQGDDRKVLAPGIYLDKHVAGPGEDDADDEHRDGRGAATYKDGAYSLEWALPLDSGDKHDLQAKPGDSVRFNLVHFDGFRGDLKDTFMGGLYGPQLDSVSKWGVLRLAAGVQPDDGAAFTGPAWVAQWFKALPYPANRLRLRESDRTTSRHGPVAKAIVEYEFNDPAGKTQKGLAKIYLPQNIRDSSLKFPLYYSAGYEIEEIAAAAQLDRGYIVVSPYALEANPLSRTLSPDVALLHNVRAFPQVDDARTVIGGSSAGGYMALMMAAETFPLAGVASDVPPFNLGYNAAIYVKQKQQILNPKPADRKVPALAAILPILEEAVQVFGADPDGEQWMMHSPMAHVSRITCPVSVFWTTADLLVPIQQVDPKFVRPWNAEQFPEGLTFDAARLCGKDGRILVTQVLRDVDYEIFELPLPAGASKRNAKIPGNTAAVELPVSAAKQWSIGIVDEGAPEPFGDHSKYDWFWKRDAFSALVAKGRIGVEQLNDAKMLQLMMRYAGKEWVSTELKHLDDKAVERFDVLRGLKTYVSQSPAHAKRFVELYGKLPQEARLLPEEEVAKLRRGP